MCNISQHGVFFFLTVGSCWPLPNPHAERTSPIGHTWLHIQCADSYPPYVEGISSILNMRMCHVAMSDSRHIWHHILQPAI